MSVIQTRGTDGHLDVPAHPVRVHTARVTFRAALIGDGLLWATAKAKTSLA